jgi:hypothetical protein
MHTEKTEKKVMQNAFAKLLVLGMLAMLGACASTTALASDSGQTRAAKAETRVLRILFIGNSLTYFNNLPQILEGLANTGNSGIELQTRMISAGGATLEYHWLNSAAVDEIRSQAWDYVVLQEQGSMGTQFFEGKPAFNKPNLFHAYAYAFDHEIKKAGAKTVFMLTWAGKRNPEQQDLIDYAYMSIAKELGAIVVPVGWAWKRVQALAPNLNLYFDGAHPNATGSYLLAATIYSTLFHAKPSRAPTKLSGASWNPRGDINPDVTAVLVDIQPEEVKLLQGIAFKAAEELRGHGGYLAIPEPAYPQAPQLPPGEAVDISDLIGDWSGTTILHSGSEAVMNLKIGEKGKAELEMSTQDGGRYISPVTILAWSDSEFVFMHEFSGIWFQFGLKDDQLTGIASKGIPSTPLASVSSWSLQRRPQTNN